MSASSPAQSYASYLDAKKTVDDRALNHYVVSVLRRELAGSARVKALEIGGGLGTMIARLADWDVLRNADYTLLDIDQTTLDEAPHWLQSWASASGRSWNQDAGKLHIAGGSPAVDLIVHFACADLTDFLGQPCGEPADLLIGNAFLDLVDVPATLPILFSRLKPNGLYWFSINFDGETIFLPEHFADSALIHVYHRSMDERVSSGRPAGDSRTGRHLFQHLETAGATILASGSSDWVVHAVNGKYPGSEADFLQHILHTIDAELNGRPEIDQDILRTWLRTRRDQLGAGALTYLTHQLDFVGRTAR